MLINYYKELVFVRRIDDDYVIQVRRAQLKKGPMAGFCVYEVFLYDTCPEHDFMVGITRKAYPNNGSISEDYQFEELEEMIMESLPAGIETYKRLLAAYMS